MPENQAERAGVVATTSGAEETTPVSSAPSPTFICEFCGPEKPVAQVYQCTACQLNYCVKHLAIMGHYCFGALGKSQTIGVSGSS
jgi:hypothetical protein